MHFVDSLFTILHQETAPSSANFKLRLHEEHPIYTGHFPNNPITPGVCSLEIMTQLAAANFSGFVRPKAVESIKYLGFVSPIRTPEIEVELKIGQTGEGAWRVRGVLSAGGKPAVKMVASYQTDASNLKIECHD